MLKHIAFYAKYAVGGLISFCTPRFLVAVGVPLDGWIVSAANWFSIAIGNEAAVWWTGGILSLAFFAILLWFDRTHPGRATAQLSHEDESVGLREVMYWVDEKSAWGRWQKSMNGNLLPGGHEQIQKWSWMSEIQRQAESGDLPINARRNTELERENIHKDFWDSAYLDVRPDARTLWRVSIVPKDGLSKEAADKIKALDYVDLRTNWRVVKSIWPERDKLADKLTNINLKKGGPAMAPPSAYAQAQLTDDSGPLVEQRTDQPFTETRTNGSTTIVIHNHIYNYAPPAQSHRMQAYVELDMAGGTPTLVRSFNVTSITDTAVGRLTITFADGFDSNNYSDTPLGDTPKDYRVVSRNEGSITIQFKEEPKFAAFRFEG